MKRSHCPFLTLQKAARIIHQGGVIAYPTETFYGLGVDPKNPEAIAKLFDIKIREKGKPISIVISSPREIKKWAKKIGEREKKLMRRFWPGPLTLVFRARKDVSKYLTAGSGKIGIRISSNRMACQLAQMAGGALTTTSANLSGQPPAMTGVSAWRKLRKKIDGVVANTKLKKSKGSTILDVSEEKIKLIREGEIPYRKIEIILNKN